MTSQDPDVDRSLTEHDRTARHSVARNAGHLLVSQTSTWAMALVLAFMVPRYLGPGALGELRLSVSLWAIIEVLAGFGTGTLLTLELARDRERGLRLVRPVLAARIALFLVGWLAVVGFAVASDVSTRGFVVIVFGGFSSMLASIASTFRSVFAGLERMAAAAIADTVGKLVNGLAIVALLLLGGGVVGVAVIALGAVAVNVVLMWVFLRRTVSLPMTSVGIGRRHLIGLGLPFLVGEAALIVYLQIDSVIMSVLVGEEELGWYAAADTLFSTLLFVPAILTAALFPVIGRMHVDDPPRLRRLVGTTFGSMLLAGVPMGLGVFAVGPSVMTFVLGDEFEPAGDVLRLLGIVLILVYLTIVLGRYAIGTGRQRLWNWLMVTAIVLSIPLDVVLVRWTEERYGNGALAGALSYLVTESVMLAVGLWRLGPELFDRAAIRRMGKIAVAGAAMLAVVWPLRDVAVVVPVLAGIAVYVAAVLALGILDEREVEFGRKLVARIPFRRPNATAQHP